MVDQKEYTPIVGYNDDKKRGVSDSFKIISIFVAAAALAFSSGGYHLLLHNNNSNNSSSNPQDRSVTTNVFRSSKSTQAGAAALCEELHLDFVTQESDTQCNPDDQFSLGTLLSVSVPKDWKHNHPDDGVYRYGDFCEDTIYNIDSTHCTTANTKLEIGCTVTGIGQSYYHCDTRVEDCSDRQEKKAFRHSTFDRRRVGRLVPTIGWDVLWVGKMRIQSQPPVEKFVGDDRWQVPFFCTFFIWIIPISVIMRSRIYSFGRECRQS